MQATSNRKRGDLFEDKVFTHIQRYVASGESFLNPKSCQFFKKKRYYSKDRASEIEVDISVESYSEKATEWSLLLVIECKNYSHPVSVDDVEEFVSKLDQIAGKNVKGAIFSTASFQKSALRYAKAKGIALVRMLPENQVQWILRRTPSPVRLEKRKEHLEKQIIKALTILEYVGQSEFLFGCVDKVKSTSVTELLNALVGEREKSPDRRVGTRLPLRKSPEAHAIPGVPFIGQEELELRTARVIDFFNEKDHGRSEVDLRRILDYLKTDHKVTFLFGQDLGFDATGREILGKIATNPTQIYISGTLEENSHRWRYTVAHEIGHFVLHGNLDLASIIGTHLETEKSLSLGILDDEPNIIGRLEWQANSFASCLLMRRDSVFDLVVTHLRNLRVNNFSHGIVFLDEQPCNLQPFLRLVSNLSREFNVSKQAAEYRLAQLRILNDQRTGSRTAKAKRDWSLLG